MDLLVALNAGSSSLKFGAFRPDGGALRCVLRGEVAGDGAGGHRLSLSEGGDADWGDVPADDLAPRVLDWLAGRCGAAPTAVGHRVVHGGPDFRAPVRVDAGVLARLEALVPLAPLHQPASLAPIRRLLADRPDLPQVACFDTAFHHALTPPASRYALPRHLEAEGIRRYGFHGLSYEAIAGKLAAADGAARRQRIVVAHLGSGASLCAMRGLASVDTTMGFSALDGLVMATRPGALDPGILLYLMRECGWDADRLEAMLYHESGLLGVSDESGDVRVLLASRRAEAAEALDLFAFRAAREVAAMAATLGGLDRLVFTGGIGEHSVPVRAAICARLEWLGVALGEDGDGAGPRPISAPGSRVRVEIIPTDEEAVIAAHVADCLRAEPS